MQCIGTTSADQRPGCASPGQERSKLADEGPQGHVPGRRPVGSPEVVGKLDVRDRLVDGSEPDEQQASLPAAELVLPDDLASQSAKGDATREIDPDARFRWRYRLQRFANHDA